MSDESEDRAKAVYAKMVASVPTWDGLTEEQRDGIRAIAADPYCPYFRDQQPAVKASPEYDENGWTGYYMTTEGRRIKFV